LVYGVVVLPATVIVLSLMDEFSFVHVTVTLLRYIVSKLVFLSVAVSVSTPFEVNVISNLSHNGNGVFVFEGVNVLVAVNVFEGVKVLVGVNV